MEISQPFSATFHHSHSNCVFFLCLIRISLLSAAFHPLLCISQESSLQVPVMYLQTAVRPVQSYFSHAGQTQLPQPVPVSHAPASAPSSAYSGCVLQDSLQLISDFFVLGKRQLETILIPQLLNRREDFLDLLSVPLLIQPSSQLTFARWAHYWFMCSLMSLRIFRSFPCQLPPVCPGVWGQSVQDSAFAFVELHKVSINFLRSLLIASLPSMHFWWH